MRSEKLNHLILRLKGGVAAKIISQTKNQAKKEAWKTMDQCLKCFTQ